MDNGVNIAVIGTLVGTLTLCRHSQVFGVGLSAHVVHLEANVDHRHASDVITGVVAVE